MHIHKDGFGRWLLWALFSPNGKIKRIPFVGGTLVLMLLQVPYLSICMQSLAVYILPPPEGVSVSPEYVISMGKTAYMIPCMLPIFFIRLCLDCKRLRSIGAPVLIAIVFALLFLFSPLYSPGLVEAVNMTTIAYLGILAILPAKEDRLSPLERKHRTWQALATGDGTPRRLSGKDILEWRIVRQGPAKDDSESA